MVSALRTYLNYLRKQIPPIVNCQFARQSDKLKFENPGVRMHPGIFINLLGFRR